MAFEDLKKDELLEIAEAFAVDVKESDTKKVIAAALVEEGVTPKMVEDFRVKDEEVAEPEGGHPEQTPAPAEGPAERPVEEKPKRATEEREVVVKMERGNMRYDVLGKTFRKEHPYVVMTESEAQRIFDTVSGFRLATPREAQEYYS